MNISKDGITVDISRDGSPGNNAGRPDNTALSLSSLLAGQHSTEPLWGGPAVLPVLQQWRGPHASTGSQ